MYHILVKKIYLGVPIENEQRQILAFYPEKMKMDKSVDLDEITRMTFSYIVEELVAQADAIG